MKQESEKCASLDVRGCKSVNLDISLIPKPCSGFDPEERQALSWFYLGGVWL